MKNEIYTRHRGAARLQVADISNIKFYLVCHIQKVGLVLVTHIVSFFSLLEKIRIVPISVLGERFKTAFPKDLVPPLIRRALSLKKDMTI